MQSTNVKRAFRKLDADYSGALDKEEFRNFLLNLNLQVRQPHNESAGGTFLF